MSDVSKTLSANNFINVTPSDSVNINDEIPCRGILLGVAGNISVLNAFGTAVTISGLSAGIIHPISTKRIRSTGTTATGIVAFF